MTGTLTLKDIERLSTGRAAGGDGTIGDTSDLLPKDNGTATNLTINSGITFELIRV